MHLFILVFKASGRSDGGFCGHSRAISHVAMCWDFLYVGYVDGSIRSYAIVIPDEKVSHLFGDGKI